MSLRMQLRRIVKFKVILTHDYWICGTLVSTEFIRVKSTKLFLKEFTVICVHVHAWQTNTHPRVNLFEMSTYNSCWSWSVSQLSTCMNLLRNGFQRNSWWNSQTDSQMHTFRDQINWNQLKFNWNQLKSLEIKSIEINCPDINGFQIPVKTSCTEDTDDVKQKTSLFSYQGKSSWLLFFCFTSSVSNTQNKCPDSYECKVQNGLIL